MKRSNKQIDLNEIRKIILELIQEHFNQYITKKDNCICPVDEKNDDDEDLMDIDATRIEEIKDLATVEGIINGHKISVVLDSASNKDLIPSILVDKLGLKRNTDVSYNVWVANGDVTKFYGLTNATIFLTPKCKIETTFAIADNYLLPEVILGRATLKKYNYDLFESRDHAIISYDGKNFFIPIVPDKNRQKKEK